MIQSKISISKTTGESGPGCSAHAEGCDGSTGIGGFNWSNLKSKTNKNQK